MEDLIARYVVEVRGDASKLTMEVEDAITAAANASEKLFQDATPDGFSAKVSDG